MFVNMSHYDAAALRGGALSMLGPQTLDGPQAELDPVAVDAMPARSYSSDAEDGLPIGVDEQDADDEAAGSWPQLPLPDLGAGDGLGGGGSCEAAVSGGGSTAGSTATAAYGTAPMQTSASEASVPHGVQMAAPAAAAGARQRLGSSPSSAFTAESPALQPFSGKVGEARPSGLNPLELAALQRQQEAAGRSAGVADATARMQRQQEVDAGLAYGQNTTAAAPYFGADAWQDADQRLSCGIDDRSLSAAAADRPDAWGLETWA